MKIYLSPIRGEEKLALKVLGDTLVANGQALDFADIAEAAPHPARAFGCPWLTGEVRRVAGEIHVTVILPHGANAPDETLFPQPIEASDGVVTLPPYDQPDPLS